MTQTWGQVLEEQGYLEERGAENIDNPYSAAGNDHTTGRHEAAVGIAEQLTGARNFVGDGEGENGASFASIQRERAVNSARMVAESTNSAAELETVAKDLHAMLGGSLSDESEREAVDILRSAEYERRTGNSADVFDGAGVPESLDPRIRTDPTPTQFERDRNAAQYRVEGKAKRLRNQHEHGDGDFEKKAEAQRLESQAKEIAAAETTDELRQAQGMLPKAEAESFVRDAAEVARKTNPGNKEYDPELAEGGDA